MTNSKGNTLRGNNQITDLEEKETKKKKISPFFLIIGIITLAITITLIITFTNFIDVTQVNPGVILVFILLTYILFGFGVTAIGIAFQNSLKKQNSKIITEKRIWRKRRKQIRKAGLDQLEEGEEALSPEELEERINARLASRQSTERRLPVIEILNEPPSNETILQKMMFNGFRKGKTCAICKLDIRKRQKIVQCPYCQNLFHYDHLKDWFKNNKDCPVCDKMLVK